MADKTLNIRIQLRNDTAENWTNANPILLKGEMGVETDTGKTKIGNGTAHWTALKYSGVDEDTIKGIIDNNRDNFTEVTPNEGESDAQALARMINNPKKGDMAVVIRIIAGDKKSYKAYIHNGTAFAAMDGNYSADNVYFDEDLTYTVQFGTLAKPAGSAKFSAKGKNVSQVFASLMAQEADPSKTNPAVSFSDQGGFGTFEIGTKKNLTYSASLNGGSYTYGPNPTGVTATGYTVTCDGKTADTATGSFENIVADGTKKISVSITHSAGSIPKTNKGKEYAAAQIKAGTKTATSSQSLVGVRHMFYGVVKSADFALDSAHIRSLSHEAADKKTISTFTAGDKALKVIVACPAGYNVTKVTLPSAMGADATADFVKQSGTV